ncbi:cation:proton antiporter [Phycisphaera mikurensis]|uniref:Putative antiporter n=1 Tax=Phycisphaera mikurensis (strain NBRC 102666 / KCTC 22515 / FYK2301M01) TaxID=1142394 RepID=I0IIR4_PHYMF|nr:cation:proton antiporter [Phycisphaera mikurensis]MBB6442698.1 CPA2 family monovalent cation:H+ antiporter-2 [Phycisphaera mikurensis]BAM05152.1 putative antiporter [Phycisphaera mikurensis NBRC 102666]
MMLRATLAAGDALPRLPEMVALLLGCAAIAFACVKVGVAPILGFLLAGVLLGPFGLGVVEDDAMVAQLAEVGVVLLLFTIGIEFSLEKLAKISRLIFIAGAAQVIGTVAAVAAVLVVAGVGWRAAVFTGCLVSLSSTAIVLKLLAGERRTGSDEGQATLGVLIFQDLAVVAMVLVVPMLGAATSAGDSAAGGADGGAGGVPALLWALAKAGGIVAAVLLLARRIVPAVIERVARTCSAEVFLLTLVAVCFGLAWLTSLAGVSLALGAFLAGLLISESRFSHHAFGEVMPLQVLFSAVFFASVGMRLDPGFVWANPLAVVGCVLALVALKALVTAAGVRLAGGRWAVAGAAGLLTAQVGEFAFVLQATGAAAGLTPGGAAERGVNLFIAATVVSMLATPLLSAASRKLVGAAGSADRGPGSAETPAVRGSGGGGDRPRVVLAGYGERAESLLGLLRSSPLDVSVVTLDPGRASTLEAEAERELRPAGGGALVVHRGSNTRAEALLAAGAADAAAVIVADDTPEAAEAVRHAIEADPRLTPPRLFVPGGDDAAFRRELAAWVAGLHHVPAEPVDAGPGASAACTHAEMLRLPPLPGAARAGLVCPACVAAGEPWVHLRRCAACGAVGCCDASPNRHARAHARAAEHPIVEPVDAGEPGAGWVYCYEDDTQLLAERGG